MSHHGAFGSVVCCVVFIAAVPGRGALSDYEGFSYPPGPLTSVPGSSWTLNGPKDTLLVVTPGLECPGLRTSGNSVDFDDTQGWDRVLVQRTLSATATHWFETEGTTVYITAIFKDASTLMFRETEGEAPAGYGFALDPNVAFWLQQYEAGSLNEEQVHLGSFSPGVPHFVACRIRNLPGVDSISVVVDPDLEQGEPDWATGTTIASYDATWPLTRMTISHGAFDPSQRGGWDEIRIGDTWSDVTPEPGAGTLVVLRGRLMTPGDYLRVVADERLTLSPKGSFAGMQVNVPGPVAQRAADGTIYVRSENGVFFKSSDAGDTWVTQAIDLHDSLTALGVGPAWTGPLDQHYGAFGIIGGDRFWLKHSRPDSYLSYSDDKGAAWTSMVIDAGSLHPPGSDADYVHLYSSRGPFLELADGTVQFGADIRPVDSWDPWPAADPFGEAMIRTTDSGATWGDPTFLRLPDSFLFEVDYAMDPHDPAHFLALARAQRKLLPGEDDAAVRALTGAPAGASFVYKNGLLIESTDAGRSFAAVEGGLLGYYEHRNSIAWTPAGVIVLLSEGNSSTYSQPDFGKVLVRVSVDHGQTWFDGDALGDAHAGAAGVVEFELHTPGVLGDGQAHNALGMSSTVAVNDTHFVTAFGAVVDTDAGTENCELLCVRWHLEGVLTP